jgi:hypothetical protein
MPFTTLSAEALVRMPLFFYIPHLPIIGALKNKLNISINQI